MSKGSAEALQALLEIRDRFGKLTDKDFAAATAVLVKKLMVSAGQTTDDMAALKSAVGDEIFTTVLKSLTAYQARLLARRLDRTAPETQVNTAAGASDFVLKLLPGEAAEEAAADAPPDEPAPEDTPPRPAGAYFGRKAFRTGG